MKCARCFETKRGLSMHNRQNINCDQIIDLSCPRCKKVFSNKWNLSQHLKRKTPCVVIESTEDKIKIIKTQHQFDIEKENLKTDNKIKVFKTEAQIKKEIFETKKDFIDYKTEKMSSLEKLKTTRKEKTAQVVNNTHNEIKIQQFNNCIVNITTKGVMDATEENLELPLEHFKHITNQKKAIQMVYPPKLNTTLPVDIISKLHGKDALPAHRNLWYNPELDGFYRINKNNWEYIKEEEWLVQQIRSSLAGALRILQENIEYYKSTEDMYYNNYALFSGYLHEKPNEYYRKLGTKSLVYNETNQYVEFESEEDLDAFVNSDEEYLQRISP
jgi:hypothetical protein